MIGVGVESKVLSMPKNPFDPKKHQLFKIPRSIENIQNTNMTYNKFSYKHKIPTILPEVADMLLYRHRAGQKK